MPHKVADLLNAELLLVQVQTAISERTAALEQLASQITEQQTAIAKLRRLETALIDTDDYRPVNGGVTIQESSRVA